MDLTPAVIVTVVIRALPVLGVVMNVAIVVPAMAIMVMMRVAAARQERNKNDGNADQSSLHGSLRVLECDVRNTACTEAVRSGDKTGDGGRG